MFSFQAFEDKNYQGQMTDLIEKEGFHDLGFNATSYVWFPATDNCCVTFCANKKESTGYWCDPRKRPAADDEFTRVSLWCGRGNQKTLDKMYKKCS
jgi:hypothetical protein